MTIPKHLRTGPVKPRKISDEVEARIQQAKHAVIISTDPKYTAAQAARDFGVQAHYKVLRQRLNGIQPKKKAHEKEMLLTEAEKMVLVEWIRFLGFAGIPVCKRTLRPKVKAIMEAKGMTITEQSVSPTWIRSFLKDHSDALKTARGSALDPKRAQAFNFSTVNEYFQELNSVLKDNNIPWEHVYNMDEKGVQMGGGRKNSQRKFIFSRSDVKMYRQHSDDLQLVTIIDCVCADGTAPIKPAFVFPGVKLHEEWTKEDDDIVCVTAL